MLKLTKTGIGLLTKQYRSVLRKCLLLNFCIVGMLFFSKPVASAISHDMLSRMLMPMDEFSILDSGYVNNMAGISRQLAESGHYFSPLVSWINGRHEWSGATVWGNLLALDNALYNYYYTKTEADAEYALLEAAIEDVDDKVEDVDDKVDAVEAKIGDLNETGIAGNDVATQLKYILENGSTGGAGVALSTLGYIGANTPYLNTTNEAMNFSSTYTIGGNMSTLANQIKTNETNIDNLSSRINSLSTYTGTLDLTDNYAKVIGDVNPQTNHDALVNDGINTKAYVTPNKSYTVELHNDYKAIGGSGYYGYDYRVQVQAKNQEEAIAKAKEEVANNGWVQIGDKYYNKYAYQQYYLNGSAAPQYTNDGTASYKDQIVEDILNDDGATATENNYTVRITEKGGIFHYTADVNAENEEEAISKAQNIITTGWYHVNNTRYNNLYNEEADNNPSGISNNPVATNPVITNSSATNIATTAITEGDLGYGYNFGKGTVIENIALLDNAIGDLGTTGVSGTSVAAQLKLLGEVGSEALGQKIGSWSTTKDSISQTLGEETKKYGYLTAFEYDSENEQYVGTVGDNLQTLDSALSLTAKGLDALSYDLYNYYYTFWDDKISEAAEFALFLDNEKLSNIFEA